MALLSLTICCGTILLAVYCLADPKLPDALMFIFPGSAGFKATGPCVVSGNCVSSPNYPAKYDAHEACAIRPLRSGELSVTDFSTDMGRDELIVDRINYSGNAGPRGVPVSSSTSIYWLSDESQESTGWEICLPSKQGHAQGGHSLIRAYEFSSDRGCKYHGSWVQGYRYRTMHIVKYGNQWWPGTNHMLVPDPATPDRHTFSITDSHTRMVTDRFANAGSQHTFSIIATLTGSPNAPLIRVL